MSDRFPPSSGEPDPDPSGAGGGSAGSGHLALPFFLVPGLPVPGPFRLTGPEGRHAATVRRLRVGEQLMLTDGHGNGAPATVLEVGRSELTVDVGAPQHTAEPGLRVTLVQALPKGERGELAVDLATEAGVDRIVPWAAQRCVARWKTPEQRSKGTERWRAAAREAAKQSRRPHVPEVADLASTEDVGRLVGRSAAALVLHDAAASSLRAAPIPAEGDVVLIVGPEGGLTEEELTVFTAAGGVQVRLGPQVLRTSTAAAVALGALGVLTGRWT